MFTFAFLITAVLSASAFAQSRQGIEGVWRISEITTTGPDGSTKPGTQPSMYLFTKKHYSIIYVSSDAPRAVLSDVKTASAEELRTVFVDSFIANAGTYELKAGKLTTRPMVAKSPGYMQAGTYATSSVKINGNTMTMVSESSNSGPAANPTTIKFTRVE